MDPAEPRIRQDPPQKKMLTNHRENCPLSPGTGFHRRFATEPPSGKILEPDTPQNFQPSGSCFSGWQPAS